jgi:hypothetical protein
MEIELLIIETKFPSVGKFVKEECYVKWEELSSHLINPKFRESLFKKAFNIF